MKKKKEKITTARSQDFPNNKTVYENPGCIFLPFESYSRPFIVYIATENITLFTDTV